MSPANQLLLTAALLVGIIVGLFSISHEVTAQYKAGISTSK